MNLDESLQPCVNSLRRGTFRFGEEGMTEECMQANYRATEEGIRIGLDALAKAQPTNRDDMLAVALGRMALSYLNDHIDNFHVTGLKPSPETLVGHICGYNRRVKETVKVLKLVSGNYPAPTNPQGQQ